MHPTGAGGVSGYGKAARLGVPLRRGKRRGTILDCKRPLRRFSSFPRHTHSVVSEKNIVWFPKRVEYWLSNDVRAHT